MTISTLENLVIIGSGPAGYTAALYAARAGLNPIVLAGQLEPGGALMTTTEVANFPGFVNGVMGPDLMEQMREQAERFGARIIYDDAIETSLAGDVKTVTTSWGVVYRSRAVILSMGASHKKLELPQEAELSGRGVSYCATCDGFFFKDQDVIVVGGGDTAMEEAIFLTRFAAKVTIVVRGTTLKASRAMADRAHANSKIEFIWSSTVTEIHGAAELTGITLHDSATDESRQLDAGGLFIAIGHHPRSALTSPAVLTDESGYVSVASPSTQTNIPGVFACGDLVDRVYRQAITAAGSGCAASLDAERYLAGFGA